MNLCPKCGHVRLPSEVEHPECCPACGVYFEKWAQRKTFVPPSRKQGPEDALEPSWRTALRDRLNPPPVPLGPGEWYGRAVLLVLFFIWGIRITLMDYRDGEMGTSFMHSILLPIHEAGHVIFIPFGEFMTILGGSLFQLIFPLIAAATVLWQNRDAFGAGLGVWWCGVSVIDLAPYIYDAKEPQLMMLGGHTGEDGPHDWIYLLEVFGKLQHSQSYGAVAHTLGVLVMLAGIALSALVLWRLQQRVAEKP